MPYQVTASTSEVLEDEWRSLTSDDAEGRTVKFMGDEEGPNARVVELEPNAVIQAHYHTQNQWQIVVEGNGRIGDEEIEPYGVHFTEENTTYGPIVAGEDGLTFLTLREEPAGYHPVDE